MDKTDKKQLYLTCWKHWGANAQLDMAIEEMSELTKAILKARRYGVEFEYDTYDEIADVIICLEQIECILHQKQSWGIVEFIKEEKLKRLKDRLMEDMSKKLPQNFGEDPARSR